MPTVQSESTPNPDAVPAPIPCPVPAHILDKCEFIYSEGLSTTHIESVP